MEVASAHSFIACHECDLLHRRHYRSDRAVYSGFLDPFSVRLGSEHLVSLHKNCGIALRSLAFEI